MQQECWTLTQKTVKNRALVHAKVRIIGFMQEERCYETV